MYTDEEMEKKKKKNTIPRERHRPEKGFVIDQRRIGVLIKYNFPKKKNLITSWGGGAGGRRRVRDLVARL